jgi:bifunctional ADP-heptose synthase (sugar kinase/adenylyltransferase)
MTDALIEAILGRLPSLTVGVLGDLFLDRYLDLDAGLTEPSLETGLDAYQVVRVRAAPGAAGTVINNLVALGVGRVVPVAVIGDDGEGYELRQALAAMQVVDQQHLSITPQRRTPTYTKPMLCEAGRPPRELNRLDIKNRVPLPADLEDRLLGALDSLWSQADALVVLDQVSEADCGVVTTRVRQRLAEKAKADPDKFVLADSRERIGLFRYVRVKPNEGECLRAAGSPEALAGQVSGTVYCTRGEWGIVVTDGVIGEEVPAYPVSGPIDIVGAGDATSAAIVCARAAGASPGEAAAFGCLVASITIQQRGTTGTATPAQVRQRWWEISEPRP